MALRMLSSEHPHHLPSATAESLQVASIGILQRARSGMDSLSKMANDLGIQGVGLGKLANSLGEIPYLAGIDNYHSQGSRRGVRSYGKDLNKVLDS